MGSSRPRRPPPSRQLDRIPILRYDGRPTELLLHDPGKVPRRVVIAVSQEHLSWWPLQVSNPAPQCRSVGVPGKPVNAPHVSFNLPLSAMDPYDRISLNDLPAERSFGLVTDE